jgi:hypothetical protein
MEVENVGSSIVEIREKGTGFKLSYLRGIGKFAEVTEATDLFIIKETALDVFNFSRIRRIFSLFDFKTNKIKTLKIEPGTALNAEQLIEIPRNRYDAFRLLLRVSALGVSFPVTRNLQIRIKKIFKDLEEDKDKDDTKNAGNNLSEGGDKDGVERFIGDRSWETVAIVTYEDKEPKEIS